MQQPPVLNREVFRLFDRLSFLVDGRTAYFGPVNQLEAYFSSIGYPMPDHTMPVDFVMKLLRSCTLLKVLLGSWQSRCSTFFTFFRCINPRDPEGAASRRVAIGDLVAVMPSSAQCPTWPPAWIPHPPPRAWFQIISHPTQSPECPTPENPAKNFGNLPGPASLYAPPANLAEKVAEYLAESSDASPRECRRVSPERKPAQSSVE